MSSELGFNDRRPMLQPVVLSVFLALLCIAGGASRADQWGQAIVRGGAVLAIIQTALLAPRPRLLTNPVFILLVCAIALPLLQLVPLPPPWWTHLPGRSIVAGAAASVGEGQPWRPLAMVPGAAFNAAASLVVPLAVVVLMTASERVSVNWVAGTLTALITGSMVLGLYQFTGAGFDNPLINDGTNEVSGVFANRNHFALFLSIGCLTAPCWAISVNNERQLVWRILIVLGLVLAFLLTILASGSRSGILLGIIAVVLAGMLIGKKVGRIASKYRYRVLTPIFAIIGVGATSAIALLTLSDRAISINRVLSVAPGDDLRSQSLPTVINMIWEYFPFGSGFGSFDEVFRIYEPFSFLSPEYFNHAHNDFFEVVLNGGVPGLILLIVAIGWWGLSSIKAWRTPFSDRRLFRRVGSSILLLVIIASFLDYPARTPLIMAVIAIAAMWLNDNIGDERRLPLRDGREEL